MQHNPGLRHRMTRWLSARKRHDLAPDDVTGAALDDLAMTMWRHRLPYEYIERLARAMGVEAGEATAADLRAIIEAIDTETPALYGTSGAGE